MGRLSKGILGGFSGLVGTVVGGNWKGIDYMRSKPTIRRSASNSVAQDVHHAKFRLVTAFLRSMKDLVKLGFRDFANKMTGSNSALSFTLKNAVTGVYPDIKIDYSQVLVTRGNIPNASTPSAVSNAAGVITSLTWTRDDAAPRAARRVDSERREEVRFLE